jgi:hypothetical protein
MEAQTFLEERIYKISNAISTNARGINMTAKWSSTLNGKITKDDARGIINDLQLIIMQAQELEAIFKREYNFL